MNPMTWPLPAALLDHANTALLTLIAALEPVAGAAATGLAIALATLAVRLLILPLGVAQARAEAVRARLAPQVSALNQRWAKDPQRLNRELVELYAGEKSSPVAGCLPALAQAPVLMMVYSLVVSPAIAGHANALLDATFLSVPLGTGLVPSLLAGTAAPAAFAVLGAIIVGLIGLGELMRRTMPRPPAAEAEASPLNAQMARMTQIMPFATAVIAAVVPLAAAIYLLVTAACTLIQRVLLRRWFARS